MFNPPAISNDSFNYRLFFELSPDLFCIAGFDGYFKKVNAAVCCLLGYSYEELLATPIHEFIYAADRPITAANRFNLINGKPLLNFENRYVTRLGEVVWLSWTSMPDEEEQLVYAIAKNVTAKKKIEEDRLRVIENLTKINNDLKLLNYTTSHDLRSPVNNLLAVFSLIDTNKIQDKETLDFIAILEAASQNLKSTLNNYTAILDDKQVVKVDTELLYFNHCLENVLKSLSTSIESSKASIICDFSAAEAVNFNKGYLESILQNLVTNAIKYSRPATLPVIEIHTMKSGSTTHLIFSDNGLGFDMEKVKDKIFGFGQRFHNNEDSNGIGLYLVYNHVTNLGGTISLESKVNEGATFTITFKN
ncbi:MAG: PAS domain-containing sensor histidine kinase [Bacteroidota bacterium]